MPTHPIDNFRLSYTDQGFGHGPPLVLLHGFPLDSRVWDDVTDHLETQFRLILPDLRGFGQSHNEKPFTIEKLADDVHALLHGIGADPCILGGLSMGGYVALALAKKYPGDLQGLILVDTKSAADTPEGKQARNQMIETAKRDGSRAIAEQMFPKMIIDKTVQNQPAVVHALRGIMTQCPALTIQHALAAMRDREDYTAVLPTLKAPTLVIVGEGDAITSVEVARGMQEKVPGAKLAVIPNAGHMAPMEQPEAVAGAIKSWGRHQAPAK